MNRKKIVFLLILLLFVFTLPVTVLAAPYDSNLEIMQDDRLLLQPTILLQVPNGDKLVFGEKFVLEKGETLEGNLVVFSGTADLKSESVVEGDVVIIGGKVYIKGTIEGEVVVVGGSVDLRDSAIIEGNLTNVSGSITTESGAVIEGEILENIQTFIPFSIFEEFQGSFDEHSPIIIPGDFHSRWDEIWMNPIWDFVRVVFWAFIWALLAVLMVLFIPKPIDRIADAAISQPLASGGLGIITALIAPVLIVILIITICGIPVSILVSIILFAAWVLGMVALGLEVGERLARLINQDWALPVNAALGTFILSFVVNSIGEIVPCVGWIIPTLIGAVGIGAVFLTLFGTRDYPSSQLISSNSAAVIPSLDDRLTEINHKQDFNDLEGSDFDQPEDEDDSV